MVDRFLDTIAQIYARLIRRDMGDMEPASL